MKPDDPTKQSEDPSAREPRRDGESAERRKELRWAGVITVAAIAGALAALLFHGHSRALPMPPSFALPHLAIIADGLDGPHPGEDLP